VLTGGQAPQLKQGSERNWTKAKEAAFLTSLAETCNVTLSAEDAGVSVSGAYRRRKTNAAFRAAWGEALSLAYRRLELVLLERAFNGTEKVITRKDGSEERVREYSTGAGLALLKMHRETVADAETEFTDEDIARMRERLAHKLKLLKAREDGREVEGGADR
jgi:hypothetical protein